MADRDRPAAYKQRSQEDEVHERFLGDTAAHELEVLHDDGLYRHLRFRRPDTIAYYFDLVTWPGHLVVTGDCGSFLFSRTRDMFEFFAHDGQRINPHYWSEKLQAPRPSGAEQFSLDAYRRQVIEWRDEQLERRFDDPDEIDEIDGPLPEEDQVAIRAERDAFSAKVQEDLLDQLDWMDGTEHACRELISRWNGEPDLGDAWEWSFREYDYQFLWCCWAIAWGIGRYRAAAQEPVHA